MKTTLLVLAFALLGFGCTTGAVAAPPPSIATAPVRAMVAVDWPTLSYTEYSNNLVHHFPVNSSTVDAKVASLEALADTKVITVQHFDGYAVLTLTDVYTRESQGSSTWIHTSY